MRRGSYKTILLVDNEEDAYLNRKKDLERSGYKVIPVYSGDQALGAVDKIAGIDLVLMDLYPGTGMDGTQVAKDILKDHDLPVVFIVPNDDPATVEKMESITSYGFVERNSSSALWNMSLKMALRQFDAKKTKDRELAECKQAKEALRESEEKYRRLFETMSPGVIYQDADGTISYANPASEKILGLTVDQMKGKTSMDPRWKMITENGRKVTGAEHPAMIALRTGKKVGPVTRGVFIPEKKAYVWLSITAVPLYHSGGEKPFQVYATFEDITRRRQAEQALREQEALNKAIMDRLPIGIAVNSANPPVEFRYMNDKFPEIYRTTRLALSKPDAFWEVVYEDPGFRQKIRKRVLEDCDSGDPERMYWEDIPFTRSGEGPFYICASNIPLPDSQLMVSTVWDVTERKKAEEKLNQERLLLRTIIDSIPDSIYVKDLEARKFIANKANYRHMGFEKEEDVIGKTDFDIYPPEVAQTLFEDDQQVLKHGESVVNREEKILRSNGEVKWNLTTKVPLYDPNGVIMGMVGIGHDITGRKLAENQIRRNLEEKNVMLAEIHHRVKNNMAVISSLLELQTEFVDLQKGTENLLLDTKNRIQSMAMVHELVYENSDFAEIRADKLIQRLAGYLEKIYRTKDKKLSIQVHSDRIKLDVNKSVPFTLFANEVISNAFKHGFTDRKSGSIDVLFEEERDGYRFVVADNGKGMPDPGQLNNPKSLGSTIIHGLARQLQGQLEFSTPPDGGLRVTLWFPGMTKY